MGNSFFSLFITQDSKVMSWWDYGYQITAMANRTVIVDNNTWNNTHISRVGQAMASTEDRAYEIMRELDVDYVLVIFGGLVGYSSDGEVFSWMFLLIYYLYCIATLWLVYITCDVATHHHTAGVGVPFNCDISHNILIYIIY